MTPIRAAQKGRSCEKGRLRRQSISIKLTEKQGITPDG
jgi:hypothetical protein